MQKLRKGFTLVELIIVLAIAGLIISLVFVAASAAQRNSRDTTRRADTNKLATAIDQWASNHNGALPIAPDVAPGGQLFTDGYLDINKFKDPSADANYVILYQDTPLNPAACFTKYIGYIVDSTTAPTTYHLETCLEAGVYKLNP